MKSETEYVVYTITLQGRVVYVGITNNFERRRREHLTKIGTRFSAIPTETDLNLININKHKTYKSAKAMLNAEDKLIKEYNTIEEGWNKNKSGYSKYGSRENIREYNNNWRRINRTNDEWKKHQHEWYMKNRDRVLEKMKAYQKKRRELMKL